MRLSRNAAATPHSGIREIVHFAIERHGIVRLEVGESSLPTPQHIVEAAARDAAAGFTRYSASAGFAELREAICSKLGRVNAVTATPEDVVVTAGGVHALFLVFTALCDARDAILVPNPAWPNYEMICRVIGARPVPYPCRPEHGFLPDPEEVEQCIERGTRVLVVNSPNNPTGAVYPPELMHALAEVAERRGLVLVSDEAYDEMYFDDPPTSPPSFMPLQSSTCVSVFSFSKTYAMTGWRVGYVVGPRQLAAAVAKLQEPTISCASSISQRAALAALTGPQDFVIRQRDFLRGRRDLVVSMLQEQGEFTYQADGSFYLLLDISPLASRQFAIDLLEQRSVAVAPGSAFGPAGEGFVRICYAAGGDELRPAVRRLVLAKHAAPDGRGAAVADPVLLATEGEGPE